MEVIGEVPACTWMDDSRAVQAGARHSGIGSVVNGPEDIRKEPPDGPGRIRSACRENGNEFRRQ